MNNRHNFLSTTLISVVIFSTSCLILTTQALPDYQFRIPNGDKVIAPSGEAWPGVGHYRSTGGGARNVFGEDFAAAGHRWTVELCQKDSDCDGFSNGQELGDPDCIWQEGDIPQFDVGITHPGIADTERSGGSAMESTATTSSSADTNVAAAGATCQDFKFEDLPSGYSNTSFVMPNYLVPAQHTTYVKFAFKVDFAGIDSYAVRIDPIITSPQVVHHMILYQCNSEPTDFLTPNTRGQMACSDLVAAWAVGGKGQCMPPQVGIELDSSRPWYIIDMHYDNPKGLEGIRDNSGLQITTFPKSAVAGQNYQPAGWLWAGANPRSYNIPPGRGAYELTAQCSYPGLPTSGITVFSYALHAHKLGRKVWTEVQRPTTNRFLQQQAAADCPSDCASRAGGMCSLCFSNPGCCGSLDPTACNPSGVCCSQCEICDGCQGCYAQTDTCNPNGNPAGNQIGGGDNGLGEPAFDLGCDTRYDFDLQETRPLAEPQVIYPSDILTTHCVYDSTSRTSVTVGGDATDDEMCIAFFLYYPVQPNAKCMTTNVQNDVGDGQHICQIKGQATVNDTLCTAPPPDNLSLASVGFGSLDGWLQIHIVCMILSMGLLIPIGVLVPMVFRDSLASNDAWFRYHRILQSLGVLILVIGAAVALANVSIHFMQVHHKLGVAMFVLVLLQPLNALVRPHKADESTDDENSSKPSTKRTIWEVVHKGLGRIIVIASWANIFLGVKLLKEWYSASGGLTKGLIGFQSLVIVVLVLVAAYKIFQTKKKSTTTARMEADKSSGEAA
mmetsp:Transcript_45010/g.108852  ORF Transcript_45010/g.108852 Transcript_45010/m.108852 type:complete len:782 (-) Transcript_45010:681-3026(-)